MVNDSDRNLFIQFGKNGETRIELLQTMNKGSDSPIESILKKTGPSPYHICYRTPNIEREIERLKKEKWIVIHSPKPAVAFDDTGRVKVAFLLNRNIGMIEVVEK